MRISQNKEISFQNERDFFIDARSSQLRRSQKQCVQIRIHLAPQRRFERPTLRLGEPLNICHLCSPMYRKVAIRQAFFVFRVAPCSSKFTGVVRCSPVHFSSFLDFSKKGNKNIFHLPPILAHFEQKSICSRTASLNRISHVSLKSTRWGRR